MKCCCTNWTNKNGRKARNPRWKCGRGPWPANETKAQSREHGAGSRKGPSQQLHAPRSPLNYMGSNSVSIQEEGTLGSASAIAAADGTVLAANPNRLWWGVINLDDAAVLVK